MTTGAIAIVRGDNAGDTHSRFEHSEERFVRQLCSWRTFFAGLLRCAPRLRPAVKCARDGSELPHALSPRESPPQRRAERRPGSFSTPGTDGPRGALTRPPPAPLRPPRLPAHASGLGAIGPQHQKKPRLAGPYGCVTHFAWLRIAAYRGRSSSILSAKHHWSEPRAQRSSFGDAEVLHGA